MLKVYIAAPYEERGYAITVKALLETAGFEVPAQWLAAGGDQLTDAGARMDLADVADANVLLALNPTWWKERGTGGRHVEFGYALALGKPVILLGEPSNIFHLLSSVIVVNDLHPLDVIPHLHMIASFMVMKPL